jgi:hypothetical protein
MKLRERMLDECHRGRIDLAQALHALMTHLAHDETCSARRNQTGACDCGLQPALDDASRAVKETMGIRHDVTKA